MERSPSTRAGGFVWSPGYPSSSPPNPAQSPLSWEEDFHSQMDENGIIGLEEVDDEEELNLDDEEDVELEEEEEVLLDAGTPEPEEAPPPALDNLSCHLSELLDSEPFSQPTCDDCGSPSHNGDSIAMEDWSDDEDEEKLEDESPENLKIHRPQSTSGPNNDETEEAEGHTETSSSLQKKMDRQYNWIENHDDISNERNDDTTTSRNDRTMSEILSYLQNDCDEELALKERTNVSILPHFSTNTPHIHISSEEQACNFGLKTDKTFPEHTENFAVSQNTQFISSHKSHQPLRFKEEHPESLSLGESNELEASVELERNIQQSHHQPVPSPRKRVPASDESVPVWSSSPAHHTAKSLSSSSDSSPLSTPHHRRYRLSKPSHTDLKDVRKGQLSHPLPDFSKVEPRVRFPKSVYKPPRSRRPPRKRDSKPEAALLFKSPADIVREVLLSSTEGLSDPPGDPQRPLNTAVPGQFQCPLQASTLVQQLQEDYNRLLTKYAEAENTIDRLRLEAKVGLYSDLPKHTQPVVSGVVQEGSKVMTLSFPQAQRAELSANMVQSSQERNNSGTSTRPSSVNQPVSLTAEQLTEALFSQVQRFQLQVDEFEDLLHSGRLKSYDQIQGLSQLAQGQNSLERAYLTARDQTGGTSAPFDPDRELEGLIFNSGIRLEELKERLEQSEPNQSTSEPPQAHQPTLNETEPQPKSPVSAVHSERRVGLEVSSVSEDSEGDKEEDEEELLPSLLRPMEQKHQRVERDFSNLMNHYEKFRELPRLLDREKCEEPQDSLKLRNSPSPVINDETENWQHFSPKDERDSIRSVKLSKAGSLSGLSARSHSVESLPAAPVTATLTPDQTDRNCRAVRNRAVLDKKDTKEWVRILRAPHQDGVISPETDSGFVGSESGGLTLAAHSPVQQRAAVRVTRPSVTPEPCRIKPETVSVSVNPAASSPAHTHASPAHTHASPAHTHASPAHTHASPAHTHASPGHSGRVTDFTRRRRGETGSQHLPTSSISSSPLRWPSSGISELEQQSHSAQSLSGEEAQQSDQHTQPANQNGCYLRSPSPAMIYHHGDNLKAQSPVQLTNRHEALQSLQEEVDRLKEHLEGSLRMSSSPRASPSLLEDFRNHKPSHTSSPHQRYSRPTNRKRGQRENRRSEEEEEERRRTPKPAARRRSASVPRFGPELDYTTDSEPIPASPSPAHTPRRPRERSTEPRIRSQQRSTSADRSDEGDDEAGGSRLSRMCINCLSRTSARPARHVSMSDHTHLYSRHCPLCGTSQTKRVHKAAKQDSTQRKTPPTNLSSGNRGGVYLAAAPPPPVLGNVQMIQCVPVCPSVLYYSTPVAPSSYKKLLHFSQGEDGGHRSGVRGHHTRSHSVDTHSSLRSSLDRAVASANNMREVTRRMARSLAHSCTY